MQNDKLYLVTRSDISPGRRAMMMVHASVEFCMTHTDLAHSWRNTSNYVVGLEVDNEQQLHQLATDAEASNIRVVRFFEPDLDNTLASVAIEPAGVRFCKRLRLALK